MACATDDSAIDAGKTTASDRSLVTLKNMCTKECVINTNVTTIIAGIIVFIIATNVHPIPGEH